MYTHTIAFILEGFPPNSALPFRPLQELPSSSSISILEQLHNYNRLTHSPALPLFQSTTIGLSTLSLIPGPAISSAFIASLIPVAPFNITPTLFSPTNSRIERNWSGVGSSGASTTSSSKRGFFSSARAAASSSERTRREAAHVGVWKSVRTSSVLC